MTDKPIYYETGDLCHYGVLGMKWGKRKVRYTSGDPVYNAKQKMLTAKNNKKKANKQFDRAYRDRNSWILNSQFDKKSNQQRQKALDKAASKASQADNAYKKAKKAYKLVKKYEKQKYKDTINKYKKEINKAESLVGRVYNKLTGSDRYQAEIKYDMEKRAKVNKKWRD